MASQSPLAFLSGEFATRPRRRLPWCEDLQRIASRHAPFSSCQQRVGISRATARQGDNQMEETMKKLTLVLLAVFGLMSAAPNMAGAFNPSHQFAASEAGG